MRKTIIVTVTLFVLYVATGFESLFMKKGEFESALYIGTVGVDKVDDKIRLSIISKKTPEVIEPQKNDESNKYYTAEGRTVYEALRLLRIYMSKDIFWGHIDQFILSEDIAKTNVAQYLDVFVRDYDFRFTSKIFVVKDRTAEEIISIVSKSGEDITDKLNNMINGLGAISISGEVTTLDAFNLLDNDNCSAHLPVIKVENEFESGKETEDDKKVKLDKIVVLDGYAFFDQKTTDLFGYLYGDQARGFNFIINEIKSGVIKVYDPKGVKMVLEIINSNAKIVPSINGENINVKIKVKMTSNIAEIYGSTNVFTNEYIEELIRQQNQIIKNDIQEVIDFSKFHNEDIFKVSQVILHDYPLKWRKMQYNWEEIYSKIIFDVEVDSMINRVYSIKDPIKSSD